jgi:hypothetical protein
MQRLGVALALLCWFNGAWFGQVAMLSVFPECLQAGCLVAQCKNASIKKIYAAYQVLQMMLLVACFAGVFPWGHQFQ